MVRYIIDMQILPRDDLEVRAPTETLVEDMVDIPGPGRTESVESVLVVAALGGGTGVVHL